MPTIDELLAGFGEAMTGRPLKVDDTGVCALGFHEGRRLALEPEPGSDKVHLYSTVARIPIRDADVVYGKLLTANLYGKGTGDAWFAIDPEEGAIVLNRVLTTTRLDGEAFGEVLTDFMDAVEHWSREFEERDFVGSSAEADTAPAPIPFAAMPFMIRG